MVAMVAVISSSAVDQLIMMLVTMVVFLVSTASFMPWKDKVLAKFDNTTSFVVVIAASCGIGLQHSVGVRDSAIAAQASAEVAMADKKISAYSMCLVLTIMLAFTSFIALLSYCVWWIKNMAKITERDDLKKTVFVERWNVLVSHPGFMEQFVGFVKTGTYHDIATLNMFMDNIQERLGGVSGMGPISEDLSASIKKSGHQRLRTGSGETDSEDRSASSTGSGPKKGGGAKARIVPDTTKTAEV